MSVNNLEKTDCALSQVPNDQARCHNRLISHCQRTISSLASPTSKTLTASILLISIPSLLFPFFLTFTANYYSQAPYLTMTTTYTQHALTLPSLGRGSYLVTSHITSSLPQIGGVKCGLLHLFLQHTSCALSLNENWDEDVRADMSDALDRVVVEDKGTSTNHFKLVVGLEMHGIATGSLGLGERLLIRFEYTAGKGIYRHDAEGSDDMPVRFPFSTFPCRATLAFI